MLDFRGKKAILSCVLSWIIGLAVLMIILGNSLINLMFLGLTLKEILSKELAKFVRFGQNALKVASLLILA